MLRQVAEHQDCLPLPQRCLPGPLRSWGGKWLFTNVSGKVASLKTWNLLRQTHICHYRISITCSLLVWDFSLWEVQSLLSFTLWWTNSTKPLVLKRHDTSVAGKNLHHLECFWHLVHGGNIIYLWTGAGFLPVRVSIIYQSNIYNLLILISSTHLSW